MSNTHCVRAWTHAAGPCLAAGQAEPLARHGLQVFTNSAAALPCELGPDGQMKQPASRQQGWTPAKSLVAWRQRLAAQRMQKQVWPYIIGSFFYSVML